MKQALTMEPAALVNIEAEQYVLGALMFGPEIMADIADALSPDDFSEGLHKRIYQAMLSLWGQNQTFSPVSLKPLFDKDPAMDQMGGWSYLADLSSRFTTAPHAKDLALQLRELARGREMVSACSSAATRIANRSAGEPIAKIAGELETVLMGLQSTRSDSRRSMMVGDGTLSVINGIRAIKENGRLPGLRLKRLPEWNAAVGGMLPGEYIVIAGRPGMGKSALALRVAIDAAEQGTGVVFVSMEMSAESLSMRALADTMLHSQDGSVSLTMIRDGNLNATQWARLGAASEKLADLPLIFSYLPGATVDEMRSEVRRAAARLEASGKKLGLIVVDYLQLLSHKAMEYGPVAKATAVSNEMMQMAKRIGAPMIVLSQLSRAVESREDKRPHLSDLRESGAIEQDADAVLFVYRDEYYHNLKKPQPHEDAAKIEKWERVKNLIQGKAELIAAKVRNGSVGTYEMRFWASTTSFRSAKWSPPHA